MEYLDARIALWEHEFGDIQGVAPLMNAQNQERFLEWLKLQSPHNSDSFLRSLGYYVFTGRYGAWTYWANEMACVVCWHPNRKGDLLIYPIGGENNTALASLLENMPKVPGKFQIARAADTAAAMLAATCAKSQAILSTQQTEEPVLDWLYPAHVISTEKASLLKGNQFYYARRKYKQFDPAGFNFEEYAENHLPELQVIGAKYASVFKSMYPEFALTPQEIQKSHEDMLQVALNNKSVMNSIVMKYHGETVGMFVWDVVDNTANALWFVFNREMNNLGFAQVVEISKYLKERGISHLNLGGSETEGMDFFKTRFRPVQTVPLKSVFLQQADFKISLAA